MLQKALDRYTSHKLPSGAHLELELRFHLTREQFIKLYDECGATGVAKELTCDMVMSSAEADTRRLKQVTFVRGESSVPTFAYKKSLFQGKVSDFIPYKVSVAEEGTSEAFSSHNSHLRFKARVSMALDDKWRADFTAVYEGQAAQIGANNVKLIRTRMFPVDLTPENFIEKLAGVANTYELELEYIGKDAPQMADFKITKTLFAMIDKGFTETIGMREELTKIAQLVFDHPHADLSQKGIACQAIALSKSLYYANVFPPVGCWATIKSDGQRVLVVVRDGKCKIIYGKHMEEKSLDEEQTQRPANTWVADGEEVMTSKGKVIQLFDAICADGKNIAQLPFAPREALREEAASVISRYVPCVAKDYTLLTENYSEQLQNIWRKKYDHAVDGLIMVQGGNSYRNTKHYKWKPETKNTTDFLAVKCPDFMLGKPPYVRQVGKTLYLLFCGIRDDLRKSMGIGFIEAYRTLIRGLPQGNGHYYQIQFSPCENPQAFLYYHADPTQELHGKVIELLRTDNSVLGWKFERIREEREAGNDFVVAEKNYASVLDPFTLVDLCAKTSGYFTQMSPKMREAPNRFNRFALETVLSVHFGGINKMMDLCCGRGADLSRFIEARIKSALFIDSDPQALSELIRRRLEGTHKGKPRKIGGGGISDRPLTDDELTEQILQGDVSKYTVKDTDNLTTYVLEADLTKGMELVSMCRRFGYTPDGVDGAVCNMGLHYLCDTVAHIKGVIEFVATMLLPGGHFAFIVMDGQKVFDLMSGFEKGQTWEKHEDGAPKYTIRKDYAGRSFAKTGQMIAVQLPFAKTTELRSEPLCNVDYVKELAASFGLRCIVDHCVTDHLAAFQASFINLAVRLTADDKTYLGLHRVVCCVKE